MVHVAAQAKHIEKRIPVLIKTRRKELGLTLQQVAEKSGLSTAFVSQAERGKTTPSLVSLFMLAGALDTDINFFIAPPKVSSLIRKADDPLKVEMDSPVTYYRLDGNIPDKKLNALIFEVPAGCDIPKANREGSEDFFYVLEGKLEVTIAGTVDELGVGDSLHVSSHLDHDSLKVVEGAVRLLWVGNPAIFTD